MANCKTMITWIIWRVLKRITSEHVAIIVLANRETNTVQHYRCNPHIIFTYLRHC